MKKIFLSIVLLIFLLIMTLSLSGCTLKIETTDNSVSASVDGDTTEKVDNILAWIKERIHRVFNTSEEKSTVVKTNI